MHYCIKIDLRSHHTTSKFVNLWHNGHLYAALFCVACAAELYYMRIPSDEAELSASWADALRSGSGSDVAIRTASGATYHVHNLRLSIRIQRI